VTVTLDLIKILTASAQYINKYFTLMSLNDYATTLWFLWCIKTWYFSHYCLYFTIFVIFLHSQL